MNRLPKWTLGLSCLVAGSLYGCGTMGSAMGFEYDAEELKRAVTFETRCPAHNIEILDAMEAGIGHSKFKLRVCGTPQRWNRLGTSYFLEGKDPMAQAGMGASASGKAGPAGQSESQGTVVPSQADQGDREKPAEMPEQGEQAPPADPAQPQAPEGLSSAAPESGCAYTRDDIESLQKRIADLELQVSGQKTNAQQVTDLRKQEDESLQKRITDLELQVSGQKTNAQLMADLRNLKDNGWKLRMDAAKLLGERRASEALPDLRQLASSPKASAALKKEIENAVQRILSVSSADR